ncbi:MAG: hypothetical protein JAZ15_19850, partial [Candidatus Thiodiazotropha endolucinida]|nr:hypothetical protein [Candidatus Thiodiazotropha taylori]MCW4315274.1 hypothetical protein [Candidatus Thiodiazotropha taylori]
MASLQGLGSGRPVLPIKLTTPGQLQQVAEQQSERIDLLTKLPIRNSGFSSKLFKPLCERFGRMIAQADIGMVRDIVFNMSSIPVFGLIRDPKKRQYLQILGPKTRNARVSCTFCQIHGYEYSILNRLLDENIYRTISTILQYQREQYIPIS